MDIISAIEIFFLSFLVNLTNWTFFNFHTNFIPFSFDHIYYWKLLPWSILFVFPLLILYQVYDLITISSFQTIVIQTDIWRVHSTHYSKRCSSTRICWTTKVSCFQHRWCQICHWWRGMGLYYIDFWISRDQSFFFSFFFVFHSYCLLLLLLYLL